MAVSVAMLAAKIVLIAATDKRTQTVAASVVVAALTPFILVIVVILSALSGASSHNNAAVDLILHGGYLFSRLSVNYRMYIEKMRESFVDLDAALADINAMSEDGEVDAYQVKAIFYSLSSGADQPRMDNGDYRSLANCFMIYKERLDEEEESYTVTVPITNLETVYGNLAIPFGKPVTAENKSSAQRIYVLVKYGQVSPGGGLPPGEALGDGGYAALIAEAGEYLEYPYVWGGSASQTLSDCSGFVCWVYTQSGVYNLSRTSASGVHNQCAIVPRDEVQLGDLVFFIKTYVSNGLISHTGIYVGGGKMLHCRSLIQCTSIEANYWREHFHVMGRLPN